MKALEYLLNFKTNKATISDSNGQIKTLKENILGIGTSLGKVHGELTKFAHSQKWANITSLTANVASGFANIAGSVKNAFVGAYSFMDGFATQGDKVAKTSRLVGLSVKDYQALAFAADRSGVSLETMNASLQRFNVNLGKAKSGDKTALKMFDSLLPKGVNQYASGKDVILAMADSYTKLSTAQKAFVSQTMFGRGGLQMNELLSGGADAVQALLTQYEDLGGGLTDEGAKNAETFKDELTNMNVVLNSMKITVAGALVPAFTDLFKTIAKYFKGNRGEIQKMFKDFSTKLVDGVKSLLPKLPKILDSLVNIAGIIASIVDYIGPIKSLVGVALLGSLGSVVTIVTSLIGLLGGPAVAAIAGVAVGIASLVSIVKQFHDNWDMLISFIKDDVWGGFKNSALSAFGVISDALEKSVAGGVMRGLRAAIKAVPVLGDLAFGDVDFSAADNMVAQNDLSAGMAETVRGTNTTTTNRFAVDFKNMPKGVQVTPPPAGDFDYSYGYTLGNL